MVRVRTLVMVSLKPSFLPTGIWLDQLWRARPGEMSKQAKCVLMFAELPVLTLQDVFACLLVHRAFTRNVSKNLE